jgi:hypothetical protein
MMKIGLLYVVLYIPVAACVYSLIARSVCVRVVCFKVFTQLRNSIKITVSGRPNVCAHKWHKYPFVSCTMLLVTYTRSGSSWRSQYVFHHRNEP